MTQKNAKSLVYYLKTLSLCKNKIMSKVRIFSTKSSVESMGLQNYFKEKNLYHEVIDKTDSSYASVFGDIEIYVNEDDEKKAQKLLEAYFDD